MTYNMSTIMTVAWEIKREEEVSMSDAMKKSWAIAKAPQVDGSEFSAEIGNGIATYKCTEWNKGDHKRIYANLSEGSRFAGVSVYYDIKTGRVCGSTDLNSNRKIENFYTAFRSHLNELGFAA